MSKTGEMDEVNRWTAAAFGRPLAVADATRPADTDNLRVLTSSHKVMGNVSVWSTPLADQVMVTGLSLYFPLHTGPVWDVRPYNFRSAMTAGIVIRVSGNESAESRGSLRCLGISIACRSPT